MLIKITNYCSMGCSHCMEDSTVAGQHMTRETFLASLALTERLESVAWSRGVPRLLLISGGEATEHPDVAWFLETARSTGHKVVLITNGMWLDDPDLRAKILRPDWPDLMVQVTNDPQVLPEGSQGRARGRPARRVRAVADGARHARATPTIASAGRRRQCARGPRRSTCDR